MPHHHIDNWDYFWTLGIDAVRELETERGILASAKTDLFGCIFGRDSLITSLHLLRVHRVTGHPYFLDVVRKALLSLADLQGTDLNIESGEQPGKVIHEYRPDDHEHLTGPANPTPWFVYPEGAMRNYDTVDATTLFLIAVYRYQQAARAAGTPDTDFERAILPHVKAAIHWILWYGDSNGDGLLDYQLHPDRRYGGLQNQNWMDSSEATFHEDGSPVVYPLAPLEAQAYAFAALTMWSRYFGTSGGPGSADARRILERRAADIQTATLQRFIVSDGQGAYLASAIDATGSPIRSVRSSMGHCLWACLNHTDDGELVGILPAEMVDDIVRRLLSEDMFEPEAGIRTLSTKSTQYGANSYHNGSIWPHDNGLIAEGLEHYGYVDEAWLVRIAMLRAIHHYQHPVELYVYEGEQYHDYLSEGGQRASQTQAWAAAAILAAVAPSFAVNQDAATDTVARQPT